MDIMSVRRRILAVMASGQAFLWKTVTLTEDRKTDAVALKKKWLDYLEISEQTDLNDYVYVAIFSNNTQGSYRADVLVASNSDNGEIRSAYIRGDWSSGSTNNGSMYANAGTVISVYKLPRQ